MPTEKFANLAETNLASAYSAGAATIVVNDPSLFPTVGNFRVRLGNGFRSLLRVTAVAGATFTVNAEFNDGAAPIGTAVVLVNTTGAEDARKADIHQLLNYASLPASEKAGIVIYPNDSMFIARDTGAGFNYFGPIWKSVPLDQSGWTWFNQGSATVVQQKGLVSLLSPSAAGTNIRGRLRGSYPSTPFTLIVGVMPQIQFATAIAKLGLIGVTISDGTQHKIFVASSFDFNTASGPNAIWVGRYSSPTVAVSATVWDSAQFSQGPVWFKIDDDGVNLTFSFSYDKVNWQQLLQEGRTAFLTPSDIGIVITAQGVSQVSGGTIISWELQ